MVEGVDGPKGGVDGQKGGEMGAKRGVKGGVKGGVNGGVAGITTGVVGADGPTGGVGVAALVEPDNGSTVPSEVDGSGPAVRIASTSAFGSGTMMGERGRRGASAGRRSGVNGGVKGGCGSTRAVGVIGVCESDADSGVCGAGDSRRGVIGGVTGEGSRKTVGVDVS